MRRRPKSHLKTADEFFHCFPARGAVIARVRPALPQYKVSMPGRAARSAPRQVKKEI
jgi:hypothetical protein